MITETLNTEVKIVNKNHLSFEVTIKFSVWQKFKQLKRGFLIKQQFCTTFIYIRFTYQ